jgi:hypothetical protein
VSILRFTFAFSILLLSTTAFSGQTFEISEDVRGEIGLWAQTWYQYVTDAKNGEGEVTAGPGEEALNDFIVRRAYLYVKGQATPRFTFFTHLAADRVGQEGLDAPSVGLGSGVAWRDFWMTIDLHETFKVQLGRMYVPLTRAYGTTSTKAMLTTELPLLQGGVRGSIFYASKVGRDDGVTLWGNPAGGRVQYRVMISEGVEGSGNPKDRLRFAGRASLNLLDAETDWFNRGSYLGSKRVLSLGAGVDSQQDLMLDDRAADNLVWTVDIFFDHPLGSGAAVSGEAAYVNIRNGTQTHNLSNLAAGDDATNWYVQAGVLLPGGIIQPYFRYETVSPDGKAETSFYGGGANVYLSGHNAKVSLDYLQIRQEEESSARGDHTVVTLQLTVAV